MKHRLRSLALGVTCIGALLPSSARTAGTADLSALAWLAGSWGSDDGKTQTEEHWIAPKGGSMLGLHRDVRGDRTVSFEFLRIEAKPEGTVYIAMPQGGPATSFKLVERRGASSDRLPEPGGQKRAVFENLEHDFPQRVLYWLSEDGALHARIEGVQGGKTESEEWTWRPLPSPKPTRP